MAIFLAYCLPMSRKSQNGKFMDLLKYILWDFDKKIGYFLFLLSIDADRHTYWWSVLYRKGIALHVMAISLLEAVTLVLHHHTEVKTEDLYLTTLILLTSRYSVRLVHLRSNSSYHK